MEYRPILINGKLIQGGLMEQIEVVGDRVKDYKLSYIEKKVDIQMALNAGYSGAFEVCKFLNGGI